MIDHLEIESTVLHKESEEAKLQMQREGANKLGKTIVRQPESFAYIKKKPILSKILCLKSYGSSIKN